jgi:hypothetical protein
MRQPEDTDRRASLSKAKPAVRKPYRKPAVRYERVFETQALSCGKIQTTQGECHSTRKNS